MKKVLKTLTIASFVLFLLLPTLASCGKCKHKETVFEDVVPATCDVAGVRAKVCEECGEELGREEYEQAHIFEEGLCVFCGVAQYGSQYLEYSEVTLNGEEGYKVIGLGNCTAINIEIPSLRNGKPVLAVANGAFAGNKVITSVSFGKNVASIGEKAFLGCEALTSVTFHAESELSVIGGAAFSGCLRLKAFAVPAGVSAIPTEAFKGCKSLEELSLHGGITDIGENALEECNSLAYSEENGARYLGPADVPHLLLAGVTDKSITEFSVPADTKIIGNSAFLACTNLVSVSIPEGVLGISSFAFGGCAALQSLLLPSTLESIGASAFAQCISLASITIPDGVSHIGEKAFHKCTALTEIELPSDIKTVGAFAFLFTALRYTEAGGGKYLGNTENPHLVLVGIEPDIEELIIHSKTRVVANGALADENDAQNVFRIEVGAEVLTLGSGSFLGCASLEELVFATTEGWSISSVYGQAPNAFKTQDSALNARVASNKLSSAEILVFGTNPKEWYWYR